MIKFCRIDYILYIQKLKVNSRQQSQNTQFGKRKGFSVSQRLSFGSVAKIWDVVVGVTPVTLGGIVGDSQMVKSRKENEQPNDDDRNGAVWMLKTKKGRAEKYLGLHVDISLY